MSKPSSIFNNWAPPIFCTLLGSFLTSKGAFDGFGQSLERSLASTLQWAVEPIFYPRWFVLTGTVFIFIGGAYLFWRQYKRIKELGNSHDELIDSLGKAFKDAADNLEKP
ncbi:hypothetical protein [Pseudomonas chlororaphis]|uniref:hypothetical protein n=1 Tax=Pseudomonas chlororaphis TaxID=587753 RepID=UPI000F57894D|nr:hypothetical protein [Pseudomonas chlororaphis]